MGGYTRRRRLRLFLRDWLSEWGIAWSLARTHDCERAGGHFWGAPEQDDLLTGWWRACSKCGCSESVSQTTGTGSLHTVRIWPNATNASGFPS